MNALVRELVASRFDADDVEDALSTLSVGWQEGVAAWPRVSVDEDAFAGHVLDRLDAAAGLAELRELALSDLYLACACLRSDDRAVRAFVSAYGKDIDGVHRRGGGTVDGTTEFRQEITTRLLVGADGTRRLIAYRGRGPLRYWVRVVAARRLADVRRRQARGDPVGSTLPSPGDSPEAAYLQHVYRESFEAAMAEAFAALPPRQRQVLRHQVVDGMPTPAIAALLEVHRGTASRWIKEARDTLLWSTRDALVRRFGVPAAEIDSVMRLIRSGLNLSVQRLLEPREGDPEL